MINLDVPLLAAKSSDKILHSQQWVDSIFSALCDQNDDLELNWDRDAGEKWAVVMKTNNSPLALIRTEFPLVLVMISEQGQNDFIEKNGVTVVNVGRWEESSFTLSRAVAEEVFETKISDEVDFNSLSPHDLWWATV